QAFGGIGAATNQIVDQRPTAGSAWLRESRQARFSRRPPRKRSEQAERTERVIGHLARPHNVPQRVEHHLFVPAAARAVDVAEEARASGATDSTSRRSAASDRRRRIRRTSG